MHIRHTRADAPFGCLFKHHEDRGHHVRCSHLFAQDKRRTIRWARQPGCWDHKRGRSSLCLPQVVPGTTNSDMMFCGSIHYRLRPERSVFASRPMNRWRLSASIGRAAADSSNFDTSLSGPCLRDRDGSSLAAGARWAHNRTMHGAMERVCASQ